MSIASALVLYAVIWFMTLLVALPIRIQTQGDLGKVTDGTHASAPEHHHLGRKIRIVTVVSLLLWAVIAGIILSGWITVQDIDFFNRMRPPSAGDTGA